MNIGCLCYQTIRLHNASHAQQRLIFSSCKTNCIAHVLLQPAEVWVLKNELPMDQVLRRANSAQACQHSYLSGTNERDVTEKRVI